VKVLGKFISVMMLYLFGYSFRGDMVHHHELLVDRQKIISHTNTPTDNTVYDGHTRRVRTGKEETEASLT
jgi:hypothetical protein